MSLPTKSDLQKLDWSFMGSPFCYVEAKQLNSIRLDVSYMGSPFVAFTSAASSTFPTYTTMFMSF